MSIITKIALLTAGVVAMGLVSPVQQASAITRSDAAVQFVKIMDRDNKDIVAMNALLKGTHYYTTWASVFRRLQLDDSKMVYLLQTDTWPTSSTLKSNLSKLESYKTQEGVAYGHAGDAADHQNSKWMFKYNSDSLRANDKSFVYENAVRVQLGLTKRKKS